MNSRTAAKYGALGCLVVLASSPVRSQRNFTGHGAADLPVLHIIQNAALSPSYSCNPAASAGYGTTALFLSEFSRQANSPELLFNGACGSADYFDVDTNGDEMSLIADLGTTPLSAVTTQAVFNLQGVNVPADYTRFSRVAAAVQGHTYAAVINSENVRGLFVFTITRLIPNQEVDLQYDVKDYQVNAGPIQRSPGFDWNQ